MIGDKSWSQVLGDKSWPHSFRLSIVFHLGTGLCRSCPSSFLPSYHMFCGWRSFPSLARRTRAHLCQAGAMAGSRQVVQPGSAIAPPSSRTRSAQPAPRPASALVKQRSVGSVRATRWHSAWSARFQFRRDGTMKTYDGPARTRWEDAEADRKSVAACIEQVARSQRENTAWLAIESLRQGGTARCAEEPGSASSYPAMDSGHAHNMTKRSANKSGDTNSGHP